MKEPELELLAEYGRRLVAHDVAHELAATEAIVGVAARPPLVYPPPVDSS